MNYITIGIITDLIELRPELEYLCKLLESMLAAHFILVPASEARTANSVYISYCQDKRLWQKDDKIKISIRPDRQFWIAYQAKQVPHLEWNDSAGIPVLSSPLIDCNDEESHYSMPAGLDFLAAIFFMVTRMEEVWGDDPLDRHGRCLYKNSHYTHDTITRPLVNEYADKIKDWLNKSYGLNIQIRQEHFTALISHDIDLPYFYGNFRSELSEVLSYTRGAGKYRHASDLLNLTKNMLGFGKDPYETFDYICKQEKKREILSTWFILMSRDNQWGLKKKKYRRRLRWLVSHGYEIGIHPGYDSAFDVETIRCEKEAVERMAGTQISGVRNHFLRFAVPNSLHNYEQLGLLYDSTLGYAEQDGFRAGIAAPFKPFDINTRTIINVIEIPLIIMDGVLQDYQGMSPQKGLMEIQRLIDVVATCNGTITFNWHNTFLAGDFNPWRDVYEKSLDYLTQKNAFMCRSDRLAQIFSDHWK